MPTLVRLLLPLLMLSCTLLGAPVPVLATVAVPVPPEALAEDADAIVIGHVTRIEGHWDGRRGQILSTIVLSVDDVLKGDVDDTEIELVQPGGTVGGITGWLMGSPEFQVGEKVLVFLAEQPDGSVRVAHLYLGKYAIVSDAYTGEELAVRDPNPAGVIVLPSKHGWVLAPHADAEDLPALKERIGRHAHRVKAGARLKRSALRGALAPLLSESSAAFTFFADAARWFEPDRGQAITVHTHASGEVLAPGRGFNQIRDALAAWSSVPGSALRLRDGGTTQETGIIFDGVNAISFRDPWGQIGTPGRNCSGILALGAHFYNQLSTKTVNGKRFYQILEGDLVTNSGFEGCGFYEIYANFAEVITHELGHVLGFDHSRDSRDTMYGYVHFDGRGAGLKDGDKAGVVFAYPGTGSTPPPPPPPGSYTLTITRAGSGTGTVTSQPAGINCGSTCSTSYGSSTQVQLTATPGPGSTFTGWSGGCTGTASCSVNVGGSVSVTATFGTAAGGTKPDLRVIAVLNAPSARTPGTKFKAALSIVNAGGVWSRSARVGFYLTTGTTAAPEGLRLPVSILAPGLAPAGTWTYGTTLTVPSSMAMGTYHLVTCIDIDQANAESDETNNCRMSPGNLVITRPDVRMSVVGGLPASVQPGGFLGVSETARNDSAVATTVTSWVRYHLSPTPTRNGQSVVLSGYRQLPLLQSGGTSSWSGTVRVPWSVAPGSYYVIACIDPLKGVAEADVTNNCLASTARVTVP